MFIKWSEQVYSSPPFSTLSTSIRFHGIFVISKGSSCLKAQMNSIPQWIQSSTMLKANVISLFMYLPKKSLQNLTFSSWNVTNSKWKYQVWFSFCRWIWHWVKQRALKLKTGLIGLNHIPYEIIIVIALTFTHKARCRNEFNSINELHAINWMNERMLKRIAIKMRKKMCSETITRHLFSWYF